MEERRKEVLVALHQYFDICFIALLHMDMGNASVLGRAA